MYHPRLIENSHPTRLPRAPTTSTLKYCTEYGHGATVEIGVDMHKVTTERSVSVGRSPLLLHASNKSPSGSGQRGIFRCGGRSPPLLSRCFSFSVRSFVHITKRLQIRGPFSRSHPALLRHIDSTAR